MTFTLALAQMLVKGGDREGNLATASVMIQAAADSGADIVLLPEAMDLGWTHPSALSEAEPLPDGETCRALCTAARENGVFVCSGLIEKAGERIYNAAVLIDSGGNLLLHHRKLNELEIGHEYYQQGDRLNVCQTKFGTIGLMICADAFARDQVLTRSLCYMGADIILSPSAWAVPPDHDNAKEPYGGLWENVYGPVAKEFAVWIAGVSNVGEMTAGPWQGHNGIGCSQVIDPTGKQVVFGPYGVAAETILYTDIEIIERPARGCGWANYWANQKSNLPSG
jgi:predicted amidohydrolase